MQGRAEDFIPRFAELGMVLEEDMLVNKQDMGAGWVPKRLQVRWSRQGLRAGERKEGGQDTAAKEVFGCLRRGVRLGEGDKRWEARSMPESR